MVGKTKYIVTLSAEEREELKSIVHTGRVAAAKRRRAQILLYADEGEMGPSLPDSEIARIMDISGKSVWRTRKQLVDQGLKASLERKKRETSPNPKKLLPEQEARLVSLACLAAPEGRSRWTLKLLSERMVALDYVESLSRETVRRVLKKHHQTLAT